MARSAPSHVRRAALATLLLAAVAGAAAAQPPTPPPHGRRGPPPFERVLERHAERLGLDSETRTRIREIAEEARAESEPLRETLRELHDALHRELARDEPDEAGIMEIAERIGSAETAERKLRLRSMLRIRALLTKEQRAELVEIHAERRAERAEHGPPR